MPTHQGAPSPPIRPASRSRVSTDGVGSRPMSRISASAGAVEHRGDPPRGEQHRHHADARSRVVPTPSGPRPRPAGSGTRRRARPGRESGRRATRPALNAETRASSSPVRQAARQRRSASGSAKPSAAWASQGSSAADDDRSEPAVTPGAGATGTSAYVAAPHSSSQRDAPVRADQSADHPQEPPGAPQRDRHGEHEQRRRPSRWCRAAMASSASGATYGGAGTSVPSASGCQDSRCSRHQSPTDSGAGERPPPVTSPNAGPRRRSARAPRTRRAPRRPGW